MSQTLCDKTQDILRGIWHDAESLVNHDFLGHVDEEMAGQSLDDTLEGVAEDRLAIEEETMAFSRLVSFNSKVNSVVDKVSDVAGSPYTAMALAGGLLAKGGMMLYAASQGEMIGPDMSKTAAERLVDSLDVLIPLGAFTMAQEANAIGSSISKGYARLKGLGEANLRLVNGANPGADKLVDRLTDSEVEAYRNIVKKGYALLHNQDYGQMRQYLDKIDEGISALVDGFQSAKNASEIENTLWDIEARLSDAIDAEKTTQPSGASPTTPGMA